jgi:hypothetical protein
MAIVKAKIVLVGAVVVGAALVAPLFAETQLAEWSDPNDARGLMDVKELRVSGRTVRRFRVITFPRWKAADIRDRAFVMVSFDTFGDSRFDYYALAQSTGSQMEGRLFRDRKRKKDYSIGRLDTWRASKNSVSIRVRIGKMRWPAARDFYRWRVQTLFTGNSCQRVCFDLAPNSGAVTTFRPGASPTPTISPTPSPTATPTPSPTAP